MSFQSPLIKFGLNSKLCLDLGRCRPSFVQTCYPRATKKTYRRRGIPQTFAKHRRANAVRGSVRVQRSECSLMRAAHSSSSPSPELVLFLFGDGVWGQDAAEASEAFLSSFFCFSMRMCMISRSSLLLRQLAFSFILVTTLRALRICFCVSTCFFEPSSPSRGGPTDPWRRRRSW